MPCIYADILPLTSIDNELKDHHYYSPVPWLEHLNNRLYNQPYSPTNYSLEWLYNQGQENDLLAEFQQKINHNESISDNDRYRVAVIALKQQQLSLVDEIIKTTTLPTTTNRLLHLLLTAETSYANQRTETLMAILPSINEQIELPTDLKERYRLMNIQFKNLNQQIISSHDKHPLDNYYRAWALLANKNYTEAITLFESLSSSNAFDRAEQETILFGRAMAFHLAKKYEKSLILFQQLKQTLTVNDLMIESEFRISEAEFNLKHWDSVIKNSLLFVTNHPATPFMSYINYFLGIALHHTNRYAESYGFLEKKLPNDVQNISKFYLGEDYYHLNKFDLSIKNYQLVVWPYDDLANYGLGWCFYKKKNFIQAIAAFNAVHFERHPELEYHVKFKIAGCYYYLENYAMAQRTYRSLFDLPNLTKNRIHEIQLALALTNQKLRLVSQAITLLNDILSDSPSLENNIEARQELANIYFNQKQYLLAIHEFTRLEAMVTDPVQKQRESLKKAACYYNQQQYTEALAIQTKLISAPASDEIKIDALAGKVDALMALSEYDQARTMAKELDQLTGGLLRNDIEDRIQREQISITENRKKP